MTLTRLAAGAVLLLGLVAVPAGAKTPPLKDPVFLNIGFVCRWQTRCIQTQQKAMRRALAFVNSRRPAAWKIQQCNRNASRRRGRVDWIGYDNCIRNPRIVRRR